MDYLAYGSNLHPLRLKERAPTAHLRGAVEIPHCRLVFDKQSSDGSGKCTLSSETESRIYAVVYERTPFEVTLLDRAEGLGKGYRKEPVQCLVDGAATTAFTYVAEPTHRRAGLPVRLVPANGPGGHSLSSIAWRLLHRGEPAARSARPRWHPAHMETLVLRMETSAPPDAPLPLTRGSVMGL